MGCATSINKIEEIQKITPKKQIQFAYEKKQPFKQLTLNKENNEVIHGEVQQGEIQEEGSASTARSISSFDNIPQRRFVNHPRIKDIIMEYREIGDQDIQINKVIRRDSKLQPQVFERIIEEIN